MVKLKKYQQQKPDDALKGEKIGLLKISKIPLMVLLFISFCSVIFAVLQINEGVDGDSDWPIKIFALTFIWLLFFLVALILGCKTPYLFSSSYVLSLSLFHLGAIYLLALGYVSAPEWTSGALSSWVELASWYVYLSLASYGIGFSFGYVSFEGSVRKSYVTKEAVDKFLYLQGIGLLIASVIFLVLAIKSYGNIFAYTRQELYGGGADSRGLRTFMMVFPSAVILLVISADSYRKKIIAYSLGLFAVALFMISGYRSAALFPALIGVVLWVKSGKKIPLPIAIGSVVVVLIAISVAGQFRSMGKYGDLGADELEKSFEQSSVESSLAEMGGSVGVLAHALRLVPKEDPYFYGKSYTKALGGMLPNIGLSHSASGYRGDVLSDVTDVDAVTDLSPSSYMTYRIKPHQFGKGGGVGFSGIAEPYINFGTAAVVVYFILLGFLLAKLDTLILYRHPYVFLFCATMLWPLLRTVRNDFANFLKPMGFLIVVLLIWNIGLKILGKNVRLK